MNTREQLAEELMDVIFPAPYARTVVDHEGIPTPSVRFFKSSPTTITLQIRTMGPTTPFGTRGKSRPAYSTVDLNAQELDNLIAALKSRRELLS